MSQEILLELDDLLQAERELSRLLALFRQDEQEARAMYARLSDWRGNRPMCCAIRSSSSSVRCPGGFMSWSCRKRS